MKENLLVSDQKSFLVTTSFLRVSKCLPFIKCTMRTSEKLQFCLHNQPIVLFFLKTVPNPSGSISGPELTHPEASTSPSESQYCTIRCPVLHHPVPVLHFPEPILAPDGAVLDIGWSSTGFWMVKYWPPDGSILGRKCCRKSWEEF